MSNCYISSIEYHGKSYSYLGMFDDDVQFTVREIGTNKVLSKYDKPYGYTAGGLFVTKPSYWKLYEVIDFSHTVRADTNNIGATFIERSIDKNNTLFVVKRDYFTKNRDCRTLGGILVNTDWYYIEDDYIYLRQLPLFSDMNAENLVYKIFDRKQFDKIMTKLRFLNK